MPPQKIIGPYGYVGGLNSDASVITLPKGQLFQLHNMKVSQNQLIPTDGYSTAFISQLTAPATTYFTGLLGCTLSGSNYLFLMAFGSSAGIYELKNYSGSWTNVEGTSGFGPNFLASYSIEVLNSIVTIGMQTNIIGSSAPSGVAAQWTGSGNFTAFAGPAAVGIFKQVNNFLFCLAADGTLSWSAVADSLTWPAGNSITFRFGDGDYGTALGKIGTTLYIFKLNSMGALQTTSVVLSGAVTLGPLYPIFDKIGTFSMRTVDNLPTGELVFFGTDYNFYKFDGSNLINLSNRPYPQSTVQNFINGVVNGLPGFLGTNMFWVRVNPLAHCVYLVMGGTISPNVVTGSRACLAYDYILDYWYQPDYIFGDYCYLPSVGNIGGFLPVAANQQFLVFDNSGANPRVYSLANIYTAFNGTPISGQTVVSIPYTFESRDTIPLSAIVAFAMDPADSITIAQGADQIFEGGTKSPTPTGNLQRTIVPLNFEDSTMTTQLQITTSSSSPFSINPVVLDTEVAH